MDYKEYCFSLKEEVQMIVMAFGITGIVAFLFYRSAWAGILFPIILYMIRKEEKERKKEKRQQELREQFMSGMRTLNASLQAGMSMENAWIEVQKETQLLYGEKSNFFLEVAEMNHSAALNIPIEKLFLDFANRTGIEDMIQFAETFEYGKRSGGNWRKIIESIVHRMSEKYEAKQQIEVMIAEKQMEQQVMNFIPLGILAFLQFSAWDYMNVMYHNPLGVICMTVGLIGYALSMFLARKILQIKV